MSGRLQVAIEIGRRGVRVVAGRIDRGILRVRSVHALTPPEGVAPSDPERFGTWLGEAMRDAGLEEGRVTVVLGRDQIALKRLVLPTTEVDELPDMTRLAFQRDIPFDAVDAVMDLVPVKQDATSTTVLAVAAPRSACATARAIVERAGYTVERIALTTLGTTALIGSVPTEGEGGTLVVDASGEGIEFTVIENGSVRFSRGVASVSNDILESVRAEARRTWMSYRIIEGTSDVARTVLLGPVGAVDPAAAPMEEMLQRPASVLVGHPLVEAEDGLIDHAWPLMGVLLESTIGLPTIDFAQPRRARDRASERRRKVLLVGGFLIATALLGGVLAKRDLDGLRDELSGLERTRNEQFVKHCRYQRDYLKRRHIDEWQSIDIEWLEHLRYFHAMLPAPDSLVLDGWTGRLEDRRVTYDKDEKRWITTTGIEINLEGEARDRPTADALREALVSLDWCVTTSSGSDAAGGRRHPISFLYHITTSSNAPPAPDEALTRRDGAEKP